MVYFVVEQKKDKDSLLGNEAVKIALDFSECISTTTINVQL